MYSIYGILWGGNHCLIKDWRAWDLCGVHVQNACAWDHGGSGRQSIGNGHLWGVGERRWSGADLCPLVQWQCRRLHNFLRVVTTCLLVIQSVKVVNKKGSWRGVGMRTFSWWKWWRSLISRNIRFVSFKCSNALLIFLIATFSPLRLSFAELI